MLIKLSKLITFFFFSVFLLVLFNIITFRPGAKHSKKREPYSYNVKAFLFFHYFYFVTDSTVHVYIFLFLKSYFPLFLFSK